MNRARFMWLVAMVTLPLWGSGVGQAVAPAPYSEKGADTCLMCHRGSHTLTLFASPHGDPDRPRAPFGAGQLQCEACHGAGGNHANRTEDPVVSALIRFTSDESSTRRNAACLGCHESATGDTWHQSVHRDEELACHDCHTSHAAQDPVRATRTLNETCVRCHRSQAVAARKPYTHLQDTSHVKCVSCHAAHGSHADSSLTKETLNDTCYTCHAEKRGPFLWEHAPATDDCSVCHDPHGSAHPGMLKRRGSFLCQACHTQTGHPSVVPDASIDGANASEFALRDCLNCHSQIHGSNHPSGSRLTR